MEPKTCLATDPKTSARTGVDAMSGKRRDRIASSRAKQRLRDLSWRRVDSLQDLRRSPSGSPGTRRAGPVVERMAPLPFHGSLLARFLPAQPCRTDLPFEPSRGLRADSERPGEIGKSGSSSQKVHCQHPVPERQARAFHRGSCPHGIVLPARSAAARRGPLVRNQGRSLAPACGASPGPPPADALQPVARGLFVVIGLHPDRHARPPERGLPPVATMPQEV